MVPGVLRAYTGAILMISHDRSFLNELATHIVEIRQRKLRATGAITTPAWNCARGPKPSKWPPTKTSSAKSRT